MMRGNGSLSLADVAKSQPNEPRTVRVDLWFPIRRRTGSRNFIGSRASVLIAHRPNAVAFPQFPGLPQTSQVLRV